MHRFSNQQINSFLSKAIPKFQGIKRSEKYDYVNDGLLCFDILVENSIKIGLVGNVWRAEKPTKVFFSHVEHDISPNRAILLCYIKIKGLIYE